MHGQVVVRVAQGSGGGGGDGGGGGAQVQEQPDGGEEAWCNQRS